MFYSMIKLLLVHVCLLMLMTLTMGNKQASETTSSHKDNLKQQVEEQTHNVAVEVDNKPQQQQQQDCEGEDAMIRMGQKYRNVVPRKVYALKHGKLVISEGSVVGFDGDAIVNAANEGCLGGGGVDGAISRAGGQPLQEARERLPILQGKKRCLTGSAVITEGGNLNAKYCIHAVGPMFAVFEPEEGYKLLRGAYVSSMNLAKEKNLESVAFSLLSAGIFRANQPLSRVLKTGVQAIIDSSYPGLKEVHMVGFSQDELTKLMDIVDSL